MQKLQIDPQRAHLSEAKAEARELINQTKRTIVQQDNGSVEFQSDTIKVKFPELQSSNGGLLQMKLQKTVDTRR